MTVFDNNSGKMLIKIKQWNHGISVEYIIHKNDPLKTIMKEFCDVIKWNLNEIRFSYGGRLVWYDSTPSDFNMANRDTIDATPWEDF